MTTEALKTTILTLAALVVAAPALAHGFEDCTKEPKDKWQPQAEAEAAATAAGYTVTTSEVEGSCYEVHVKDKDGNPHELFYNPVDLQLVQTHDE
ncbi:MAG: PepSY domain-containing protein [Hyphomicrobium sp.]|uniref:PepSY domain-containing protein n=1 Tax=Hyphomicrobium sp. TaxID=82 RepID=UPI001326C69B|nr:PepSY domain-containing protein [Hyphomicrobium sp.]KAB2942908.1 MAG: PepSY domain-containing protein [Hyphomicrobium sp.]MBZ0210822.1 PepSY domain-containing protein [Hyphomicrobium sp.]